MPPAVAGCNKADEFGILQPVLWPDYRARDQASLPDDFRALEPPDPIPNSEVKRRIADGSVGFPHVRVGHRQAPKNERPPPLRVGGFLFLGHDELLSLPRSACAAM